MAPNTRIGQRIGTAEEIIRVNPRAWRVTVSPRVLEALAHCAHGCSNKGIAARMGVAQATARNYMATAMSCLGAESRTQAVVRAIGRQWLVLVPPKPPVLPLEEE